jgi:uncharacterized protein
MATHAPARIHEVDALRGFALFGILVVNLTAFASAYYGSGVADPAFASEFDRAILWLVAWLFETKFYLLFSFLFGYSVALQLGAAERAGKAFLPRMLRRQAGLWLIGLGHAVLLFYGDILTTYAVLGVVLLALRNQSDDRLAAIAFWLIALTAAAWAGVALLVALTGETGDKLAAVQEALAAEAAYRRSAAAVIAENLRHLGTTWVALGLMQAPCALAMFCLGLVASRHQLLARFGQHRALGQRLIVLALFVGLPAAGLYASAAVFQTGTAYEIAGLALGLLTAPLLTGGYVAVLLRLFATSAGQRLCRLLAPAGRMALSNYLLQSTVAAFIFYAYGLGLIGRLAPGTVLLIAAGIFAGQLGLSALWLKRFAYGPLEWVLRALTIASWPRMQPG